MGKVTGRLALGVVLICSIGAGAVDIFDNEALCGKTLLGYDPRTGNLGLDQADNKKGFDYSFLVPNEIHPMHAKDLLRKVPKGGILLAVGTERLLYDFLLSGADAALVIGIDVDHNVNTFHYLNSILLRLVPRGDMALYQRLRLSPESNDWKKAAQLALKDGRITTDEFTAIEDPQAIRWWKQYANGWWAWRKLNRPPRSERSPFYGVNYIFDATLFARVQNLALNRSYRSINIDLGNPSQVATLVAHLKQTGFKVHLLDLSNAWQFEPPNFYLGPKKTAELLKTLSAVTRPESLILGTAYDKASKQTLYNAHTFSEMTDTSRCLTAKRLWFQFYEALTSSCTR